MVFALPPDRKGLPRLWIALHGIAFPLHGIASPLHGIASPLACVVFRRTCLALMMFSNMLGPTISNTLAISRNIRTEKLLLSIITYAIYIQINLRQLVKRKSLTNRL